MQTAGVTLATLLFLRLVMATEAHPRIGVLVQTLNYAIDDLQHLLLLEAIFFISFSYLVYTMYGDEIPEFITFKVAFTSLIQITLGNLPSNRYLGDSVFWCECPPAWERPLCMCPTRVAARA